MRATVQQLREEVRQRSSAAAALESDLQGARAEAAQLKSALVGFFVTCGIQQSAPAFTTPLQLFFVSTGSVLCPVLLTCRRSEGESSAWNT